MEEVKAGLIVLFERGSVIESLEKRIKAAKKNISFWPVDTFNFRLLGAYHADVKVLLFLDVESKLFSRLDFGKTIDAHENMRLVLIGNREDEIVLPKRIFTRRLINMRGETKEEIEDFIMSSAGSGSIAFRPTENLNLREFDSLINTLVDGNEKQRADLLLHIQFNKTLDRISFSTRLRHEIMYNFNPDREADFASAIRDPKKMSSVRSWMLSALIWTDAENDFNRGILLDHLDISIEPDENVRYWTLAGLYQIKASYLERATAHALNFSKPGPFRILGIAINAGGKHKDSIERFRRDLHSGDFQTMWNILRMLRIVPIPALAKDVCEILNKAKDDSTEAYDAFYALANPVMANAAANILSEKPGVTNIVRRIIAVVRGSHANTVKNFSGILTVFNASVVEAALAEAREDRGNRIVVDQLRRFLDEYRTGEQSKDLYLAGYSSDTINVADDRLDIREDVQTLTAVMLAKEVIPPLAIGLFGDWGTGKSFFMQSIRAEVKRLQKVNKDNPESRYCGHIVQIDFNAWHYVDTNLWASLVSYIFEKLAAHVSPELNVEEKQKKLNSALEDARTEAEKTEIEKQGVQDLIKVKEAELTQLELVRQEKEITFKDLEVKDIHDMLEPGQKEDLHALLDDIGVPAALRNVEDLNNVVSEAYTVKGRVTALFLSIFRSKDRKTLALFLVLILGVIPLTTWYVITQLDITGMWVNVAAVIAELTVVIRFIKRAIGKAVRTINASIEQIEKTRKRIEEKLAEKRNKRTAQEIELQQQITALKAKETEALAKHFASAGRVLELEEKIRVFIEEHSLNRFLADRNRSQDYRKHLGVISTIRQDFESLVERLDHARRYQNDKYNPVDRIILYIDDLDRCPTGKVMEVLQAVHLLLAYPLFVVVVGVDPRWLLHSLNTTFTAFENGGKKLTENAEQWNTTPQNFLEKIFQIPFNLKPMTDIGFEKLMEGLLLPVSDKTPIEEQLTLPEASVILGSQRDSRQEDQEGSRRTLEMEQAYTRSEATLLETTPGIPDALPVINEESLVIKEWESRFAGELFSLIPTPRAAKRFSNIYRILKAGVRREDIVAFEGSMELPGSFQVPMILLAILIYSPEKAAQLFLLIQKNTIKQVLWENTEFKTLGEKLSPLISGHSYPDNLDLYKKWLPKVSRFSFELGRLELKK